MNDGAVDRGKDMKGTGGFVKTHSFCTGWGGVDEPNESPWNGTKGDLKHGT